MEKFPLRLTLNKLTLVITGRNEVAAKVMFLLVSVILFTEGLPQCMLGYHQPPLPGKEAPLPPRKEAPPPGIRSMSGRYASYWNAFLCLVMLILSEWKFSQI